jgi:UDP-N-acetylglucosamine transferase subunit ALG13
MGQLDVLLVSEPGGHLLELWAMRDLADAQHRAWCSVDSPDVRSLLRGEPLWLAHGPTTRNVPNLLRNIRLAWRVVRRERPRVILCTGSGVVVPFAWVGRALGARVLYVESGGRVDGPSLSCRLVGAAAHRRYVQWPEQTALVRRAAFHGRLPWEHGVARAGTPGDRVLVTAGTSTKYAFDRLIACAEHIDDAVVQHGVSACTLPGARSVAFMTFDALCAEMRAARAVVTHAGLGSVLLALAHGHRPIVMARRPELGEGVDDHQVRFARRLAAEGLAIVIDGPEAVVEAVRMTDRVRPEPAGFRGANALLAELERDVREPV